MSQVPPKTASKAGDSNTEIIIKREETDLEAAPEVEKTPINEVAANSQAAPKIRRSNRIRKRTLAAMEAAAAAPKPTSHKMSENIKLPQVPPKAAPKAGYSNTKIMKTEEPVVEVVPKSKETTSAEIVPKTETLSTTEVAPTVENVPKTRKTVRFRSPVVVNLVYKIIGHRIHNVHYVAFKVERSDGRKFEASETELYGHMEMIDDYREQVTGQRKGPDDLELKKVLAHRMVVRHAALEPLYLVQWKGFPHPVWHTEMWEEELLENNEDLLDKYAEEPFEAAL